MVGTSGSFTLTTATGTYPNATFTETGALPSGVTLSSAGILSGTPAAGMGGTYGIVIDVSNGISPDGTQDFTLTIDQAPVISSANNTTFTVGTSGSFTVKTASGTYPNTTTFTETGTLPSGVTLSSAGILSGTPAANTGGVYSIVIDATNGVSPDGTQNFTLTVDQAPAITSANNTTFTVGTSGTFTLTTASGTYPNATFSETGALPSGVTLSSGGILSGTPAAGTGGTYSIVIDASIGLSRDVMHYFTLTVDQAPAITSANNTTFTVGTAGTFTVTTATGTYPNATFSETGPLPSRVTLSSAGSLSGTPAAGTGGTYSFVIDASNSISPDGKENFTLTVDQAPAITSANNTTFTVGTAGSFARDDSYGTYPNATFTETGALPSGVTLSSGGVLSGTPAAGTGGTYSIVIDATNGISPDATQTFTLTIDQAPAITSVNNTTFTVGTAGSFTVTTASGTYPTTTTFSEAGAAALRCDAVQCWHSQRHSRRRQAARIQHLVDASNGVSPDGTQNFTLTVDQAPAITSANNTTFTVGTGHFHR